MPVHLVVAEVVAGVVLVRPVGAEVPPLHPGPIAVVAECSESIAPTAQAPPTPQGCRSREADVSIGMVPAWCNTSIAQFRDSGRLPTRAGATTQVPGLFDRGTQEPRSPLSNSRADLRSTIACTCAKMATEGA